MDTIKQREKESGHAIASPSQLYRILACPGSFHEVLNAPISPPSSYAQHGTMLHDVISGRLTNKSRAEMTFKNLEIEDKNAIEDCLDYARDLIKNAPDPTIHLEESINLASWGLGDIWGTLDLSVITGATVHILDWKFGSGVKVYVQDNEQLLAYAAGKVGSHNPLIEKVFLHIVQPFLNHYDTWEITKDELSSWVYNVLKAGLEVAKREDALYFPGEKQCQFCPAAMTCRARLTGSQETAKEVFRIHSNLAIATKEELADILVKARSLMKYASQIEAYAAAELSHGRSFPGYKLVSGRSIRRWADEEVAEAWLGGNSSISSKDLFKKKFISPAQAEKLDRHLKKDKDFLQIISKPPGTPKMVSEDDPRPAIAPNAEAAKVFEGWQDKEGA